MSAGGVAHATLDATARTIVVSDIHGNDAYLTGLLDKLALGAEDQLVVLGDMVERGPESLATLRHIMALQERCRLLPVLGNCDIWHLWLDGDSPRMDGWVRTYLVSQRQTPCRGLIPEMCRERGVKLPPDFDMRELKTFLGQSFPAEFDFLRGLPTILDTPEYTFVHGGLEPGTPPEQADLWRCLKRDRFYEQRPHFDKWMVTGHTPVCLYRRDVICSSPILDGDCRLASIDGGCVLKDDGQLNALILREGRMETASYDPYPERLALDFQPESPSSVYIPWGDNEVALLARQEELCRVRHLRTGRELDVPLDFLFRREGRLFTNDCTDYRPPVAPGDRLRVVRETSRGYWIKKDGVTGWYGGRLA